MSMKYSGKKQKSRPLRSLLLLTQPSVAILAVMLLLMQWRVPTPLRIMLWIELPEIADLESLTADMRLGRLPRSLIHRIQIDYPSFSTMRPATFVTWDKLEIKPFGELRVTMSEPALDRRETLWMLEGSVIWFKLRSQGIIRDLRMTRFDLLLHSKWALYALLAAWMLFTVFGWFKLYQELKE